MPCLQVLTALLVAADPVSAHDVVWTSPSRDESGSMPIGNGDIGANVWVEPDGTLRLYLSKTDAWDDNARLLKIGRLNVRVDPLPATAARDFAQRLDLHDGEIEISLGAGEDAVHLTVAVDAYRPVCLIDVESATPVTLEVELDHWRVAPRELKEVTWSDVYCVGWDQPPRHPMITSPDAFPAPAATDDGAELVWFHRNERTPIPATFELQGLSPLLERFEDPILHRAFGARVVGEGFEPHGTRSIRSRAPARQQCVEAWVLTQARTSGAEFPAALRALPAMHATTDEAMRTAHRAWWHSFWDRSWIRLEHNGAEPAFRLPDNALPVSIGSDSRDTNPFLGTIERVIVLDRAATEKEIEALASGSKIETGAMSLDWRDGQERRLPDQAPLDARNGLTVAAWIVPQMHGGGGGRIIDKCEIGGAGGWVLDTYPSNSLRLIAGEPHLTFDARLTPNQRAFVAATYDPTTGQRRLFIDGRNVAESPPQAPPTADIERAYVLQRYMNACAGRGGAPIKFNGSIFTVGRPGHDDGDPDFRRWGPGYWFQNTRLIYWPMFASGDVDLTDAFFAMYRDALPHLAEAHALRYGSRLAPGAATFHETINIWGLPDNSSFGWNRDGVEPGEVSNPYIRYYRSGSIELLVMALERYDYARDDAFLASTVVPLARAILGFYATYFPRDASGTIVFEPCASLETWHDATDPLPEIAGLRDAIAHLERVHVESPGGIPSDLVDTARRLHSALPPIPMGTSDAGPTLAPARRFTALANVENPELYAVFPYRLFTVGTPGLEVGRRTFTARQNRANRGWCQDSIQAAHLGLADEAAALVASRARSSDQRSRFPAFWGPNYDWVPDQDHGANVLTTLQSMLVQSVDGRIHLLPAWPREWDCDFKLHAPEDTVIEGTVRDGQFTSLSVTSPHGSPELVIGAAVPSTPGR